MQARAGKQCSRNGKLSCLGHFFMLQGLFGPVSYFPLPCADGSGEHTQCLARQARLQPDQLGWLRLPASVVAFSPSEGPLASQKTVSQEKKMALGGWKGFICECQVPALLFASRGLLESAHSLPVCLRHLPWHWLS